MDSSQTIENGTDASHLGCGRRALRIIFAARAYHGVERADRIVIDRFVTEADVIVMRSDRDVLALEDRIGTWQDGDDIARRSRRIAEAHGPAHRFARCLSS